MRPINGARTRLARVLVAAALLLAPAVVRAGASLPVDAAVQARDLQSGVNALGFDPMWKDPAGQRFTQAHFRKIRQAGFRTVRVVLFGFPHMDAQNRLDPRWLERLDWVVREGTAAGLNLILENQDMAACAADPDACRPRLTAFWRQLSERYKDQPSTVLFELLNEPNTGLDPVWNDWIPPLLQVVRATNPTRNVVVDPTGWASLHNLDRLKLPAEDRHLIVAIHYYDPRAFTHQGAAFAEDVRDQHDVPWGSPADRQRLHDDFEIARQWSARTGRPILLGEFGAYEKAPMADRARYLDAVARAAEANGWPWLVWQFDHDFAVYDMTKDAWVAPLLTALHPSRR